MNIKYKKKLYGRPPSHFVRLLEQVPRLLLEAVHRLLPVPDGGRKGVLAAEAVLVHSA